MAGAGAGVQGGAAGGVKSPGHLAPRQEHWCRGWAEADRAK